MTGSVQFKLRLPQGMLDQIRAAATARGRSANSEIIRRLLAYEDALLHEELPKASASTITVSMLAETREKLERLAAKGPYRISLTSIVERGIQLAAAELESLK